ncbi:MAG: sugar phosphate nucleotidyltransferase, partial [Opitutales bacterium]|nr:sugar phosphate nucleotidyltransferase [Opitutales bacterium]
NVDQVAAIREMCPELPTENIVAEPVGRDTAAAVGLAALLVEQRNREGVFAILPSDHVVRDAYGFRRVLTKAFELAAMGNHLVTIGIEATHPATGYGYIEKGDPLRASSGAALGNKIERFVEKPDLETAKAYIGTGRFLWNAGMFVWSVHSIHAAMSLHHPSLANGLERIRKLLRDGKGLEEVLSAEYSALDRISIDYAIMEKASNAVVIPSEFDWDDVGEWPAIERHFDKDPSGNISRGLAIALDSHNNIVYNDGDRVTALLGVEDLIVVHTADATLVCPRSKAQEIKRVLNELRDRKETRRFL